MSVVVAFPDSVPGASRLGLTLPKERAITRRCATWLFWIFRIILPLKVSIHTSLVKINLAVSEIWALPVFAARLRAAQFDHRNFLRWYLHMVCASTHQFWLKLVQRLPRYGHFRFLRVALRCTAQPNASATWPGSDLPLLHKMLYTNFGPNRSRSVDLYSRTDRQTNKLSFIK